MNYSMDDFFPEEWEFIVECFMDRIHYDMDYNNMPEVYDIRFSERNGVLDISYKGGNKSTDAYALFARSVSERVCGSCGATRDKDASVLLISLMKCENCV